MKGNKIENIRKKKEEKKMRTKIERKRINLIFN